MVRKGEKIMRILISGASLAGPSLAFWLVRAGHEVTVVERARRPRTGGSPIDVRGPAVDVAERMGLLPAVQRARVHTEGIECVDARGRRTASLRAGVYEKAGDRDVELERADLVDLLYDAKKDDAGYRLDHSLTTLAQDADGADVTFLHGRPDRFDRVVGAAGAHAVVRGLVP